MQVEPHHDIPALVPFIKRSEAGKPYLAGSKCKSCGHVFAGERRVCANCAARDAMLPVQLAETGKLYVYTVVHRTFPGVKTPFIDAIADLDDGSHLKGTLLGIEPDAAALAFDMRVKIIYHEATPVDAGAAPYLTYAFVPA
jgi:uncharacterized OB-fold protein